MGLLRASIIDDRGRRRPLVPLRFGFLPPAGAAQRATWRDAPGGPPTRAEVLRVLAYGLIVLAAFLAIAALPAYLTFYLNLSPWIAIPISSIPALLPALLALFITRHALPQRAARAYVRMDLCPSCGYDIREIAPESDACRICPECGGAWKAQSPLFP